MGDDDQRKIIKTALLIRNAVGTIYKQKQNNLHFTRDSAKLHLTQAGLNCNLEQGILCSWSCLWLFTFHWGNSAQSQQPSTRAPFELLPYPEINPKTMQEIFWPISPNTDLMVSTCLCKWATAKRLDCVGVTTNLRSCSSRLQIAWEIHTYMYDKLSFNSGDLLSSVRNCCCCWDGQSAPFPWKFTPLKISTLQSSTDFGLSLAISQTGHSL